MIEYEARTPRQVVQELDENIDRLMEQVRRLERVVLLSLKMRMKPMAFTRPTTLWQPSGT